MRPSRSDYIPLAQLPLNTSSLEPINPPTRCVYLRRRHLLLGALFSATLLTLFALLRHTLSDLDDDLDDLDLDLSPSDDIMASHTSYLPFELSPEPIPSANKLLKPVIDLPDSCLEAYFSKGDLCFASNIPKLDFLWTWVNGSDPLEQQAKKAASEEYDPEDPWRPSSSVTEARLYRCVYTPCIHRFVRVRPRYIAGTTTNCGIRCARYSPTSASTLGDSSC